MLVLQQQLFKIYAKLNTFRANIFMMLSYASKSNDFNTEANVLAANNQIKT